MLEQLSRKNFIIVNKGLPVICEGHIAAAWLLAGLLDRYELHEKEHELVEKDGLLWFFLTAEKASELFTISKKGQTSAIKKLSQLGFISVKRFGTHGKRYFVIHENNVQKAYNLAYPAKHQVTKRENIKCPKGITQSNSYNVLPYPSYHTLVNDKGLHDKRDKPARPPKKPYGSDQAVLLTDEEIKKLYNSLSTTTTNDLIEDLNLHIKGKGVTYKSHYHVILNWHRRNNKNSTQTKDQQLSEYYK